MCGWPIVLLPLTGPPIHGLCLRHFALLTVSQPLSVMQDNDGFYLTTHRASHEWSYTITLLSNLTSFVLRHMVFFFFFLTSSCSSLSTDHPTITSCSNHIVSPSFLFPKSKIRCHVTSFLFIQLNNHYTSQSNHFLCFCL
jgi:hypothetical protein